MFVFIQNEAGSTIKNRHNEKSLEWQSREAVSRPYPYPYGFALNTTAEDGDNVDCFVLTARQLQTGHVVECRPVALMQQIEDGEQDHNVLAVIEGEEFELSDSIKATLTSFVMNVFAHIHGKHMCVGEFLGPRAAEEYVASHADFPFS